MNLDPHMADIGVDNQRANFNTGPYGDPLKSLLTFPMPNLLHVFLEKDLAYLENKIVDGVRLALSLNQITIICYFFIPSLKVSLVS